MPAPKGNQFWKARTKHGRDKIFASAEVLEEACVEYFQWVDDNPLYEDKITTFQGIVKHEPVAKMRAMTIAGLCLFLGIDQATWGRWRSSEAKDFCTVVSWAEEVIRTQKFAGAAADLLNPNIIARDLGLTDKQDVNHSGGITIARKEYTFARRDSE